MTGRARTPSSGLLVALTLIGVGCSRPASVPAPRALAGTGSTTSSSTTPPTCRRQRPPGPRRCGSAPSGWPGAPSTVALLLCALANVAAHAGRRNGRERALPAGHRPARADRLPAALRRRGRASSGPACPASTRACGSTASSAPSARRARRGLPDRPVPAPGRRPSGRRAHQPGHAGDGRAPAGPAGRGRLDPRPAHGPLARARHRGAAPRARRRRRALRPHRGGHLRRRRPDGTALAGRHLLRRARRARRPAPDARGPPSAPAWACGCSPCR